MVSMSFVMTKVPAAAKPVVNRDGGGSTRRTRRQAVNAVARSQGNIHSSSSSSDGPSRRAAAAAVALSTTLALGGGVHSASAETIKDLYVAAGNVAFLEKEFIDLKYAGVKDVVPGMAVLASDDPNPVQAVKVTYDADRISHENLMRTYWKHADPTKTDGQFKEIGAQYRGAVWVTGGGERAEVEKNVARLQSSGIFGAGKHLATPILDAPPASFEAFPEEARRVLATNPKAVEKETKVRDAAFKDLW